MKMLTKKPAVTEMVVESYCGTTAIIVHVASRRAAHVAHSIAGRYQIGHEDSLASLEEAAAGTRNLPLHAVFAISPCFNPSEVLREFKVAAESIEDRFSDEFPHPPVMSIDLCLKIIGTDDTEPVDSVLQRAVRHGYFLGLSDASHWVQDDVAVAPYAGHTAKEMVGILQSFYMDAEGDERKFLARIINSEDPRLNRMSRMAIEIFFSMLNRG